MAIPNGACGGKRLARAQLISANVYRVLSACPLWCVPQDAWARDVGLRAICS